MKTKLRQDWPFWKIEFQGALIQVCRVLDLDTGEPVNPSGEYHIIEEDNTNGYGYHVGGAPEISIMPVNEVDSLIEQKPIGHARRLADIKIDGNNVFIDKSARPGLLWSNEGL